MQTKPTTAAVRAALEANRNDLRDLVLYLRKPRTMTEVITAITAAFALGFESGRGTYKPEQSEEPCRQ